MFNWIKNRFRKETTTYDVGVNELGTASWPKRDYNNFAKEAYLKNLVSFRCIDKISKSCGSVPWNVYKKGEDGKRILVEDHEMNALLKRPNPSLSWYNFIYYTMAFYLLSGNSFISKIGLLGGEDKGKLKELHVLRPSGIKILTDENTGLVTGYEYRTVNNIITYEVNPVTGESDLLHIKTFNPLDDYWGTAIVEPAARQIDTSNAATEWQKSLLDNQARPGMLLMFERNLTVEQRKTLSKDIRENREGAKNAGKTLLLEGAKDAKPYGFTPTEMDFIEGSRDKAREISMAFGVPPQLLNIKGDSTFANFAEARLFFWEDTVIDYLNMLKSEFNYWFFPDENIFLDYDLDRVPALSAKKAELWERAEKVTFISENEKREMVGFETWDGLDVILKPANLIPITETVTTDEDEIEEDNEKAIKDLIAQGFNEKEAKEMLNCYPDEDSKK